MKKTRLFTPGPTAVPEEVLLEMAMPVVHHRKNFFSDLYGETVESLKKVFLTVGEVFIFASSGTGAMEAAVANLTSPGDSVLVIESGKFGRRWSELCDAFGVEKKVLKYEWGKTSDPEQVESELKSNPGIKAVFATLVETSTGTLHPIEKIARIVSQTDAVLVVDAVSGLGCDVIRTDQWGVDVVVSGSQKALMVPPGLGFMCVSEKAKRLYGANSRASYYWNLKKASKSLAKNQTPYTPSVSLVRGLKKSLELIEEEGVENVWARHSLMAKAARAGVEAMGLNLFSECPANGLTTVKIPDPDRIGGTLVKHLQEKYGVVVAGGQEGLKGQIFRIAHMGYCDALDVLTALSSVEMALMDLGVMKEPGRGIAGAQEVFAAGL